jgi:hypothetical protein
MRQIVMQPPARFRASSAGTRSHARLTLDQGFEIGAASPRPRDQARDFAHLGEGGAGSAPRFGVEGMGWRVMRVQCDMAHLGRGLRGWSMAGLHDGIVPRFKGGNEETPHEQEHGPRAPALEAAGIAPDLHALGSRRAPPRRPPPCGLPSGPDREVDHLCRGQDTGRAVAVPDGRGQSGGCARASAVAGEALGKADADLIRAQTGFAIGGVAPVGI